MVIKSSALFNNLIGHLNAKGYAFIVSEFYAKHGDCTTMYEHHHGNENATSELLDMLTDAVTDSLSESRAKDVFAHVSNTRLRATIDAIFHPDVDPLIAEQRYERWIESQAESDRHQERYDLWYNEI